MYDFKHTWIFGIAKGASASIGVASRARTNAADGDMVASFSIVMYKPEPVKFLLKLNHSFLGTLTLQIFF